MKTCVFVFTSLVTVLSSYTTLVAGKPKDPAKVSKPSVDWAANILNKGGKGETCKKVKASGNQPKEKDSPIEGSWGTPIPDFNNRVTVLRPTVEIGQKNPTIKIGTKDFAFAGKKKEILAFCACFANVKVMGKSLRPSGMWEDNTGEIKIQVINTAEFGGNESPLGILFKVTIDRIVRHLNPLNGIVEAGIDGQILKDAGVLAADSVSKLKTAYDSMKDMLPLQSNTLTEVIQLTGDVKTKVKALLDEIQLDDDAKDLKWVGVENISKSKRVIVTLTMYDKPISTVRATYNMNTFATTFLDVGLQLEKMFGEGFFGSLKPKP